MKVSEYGYTKFLEVKIERAEAKLLKLLHEIIEIRQELVSNGEEYTANHSANGARDPGELYRLGEVGGKETSDPKNGDCVPGAGRGGERGDNTGANSEERGPSERIPGCAVSFSEREQAISSGVYGDKTSGGTGEEGAS